MSGEAETTIEQPTQSRGRTTAMWILLAVAGLLLLLSSFAIWVDRVALNTSAFTDTSSELLRDDAIRSAIATRAVDELYSSVDVQAEIKQQLPDNLQSVSGLAAAAIRQGAYEVVDRALEQPALQNAFTVALRQAHETLVDVLEGGGPNASTQGGVVTLNLRSIVLDTADRIGVGSLADKIPADAGQIEILRSDQLKTAQSAFNLLKTLAWVLPILTIGVFALAVWVARDRRRAIRGFGIVAVVVGILGLAAARLGGGYIVDSLVQDRQTRTAASDAWDIVTEQMRSSFRWMAALGLLVIVGAMLVGPSRRALTVRGWLAPLLQQRVWGYVGVGALALLLLIASPTVDFVRLLWLVLIVVLAGFWVEAMRRRALHEFPDAGTPAFVGEMRTRMSTWWAEGRAAISGIRAPEQAPAQPAAAVPGVPPLREAPQPDLPARLASLADLHARGELTDDEYAAAKAQVLAGS